MLVNLYERECEILLGFLFLHCGLEERWLFKVFQNPSRKVLLRIPLSNSHTNNHRLQYHTTPLMRWRKIATFSFWWDVSSLPCCTTHLNVLVVYTDLGLQGSVITWQFLSLISCDTGSLNPQEMWGEAERIPAEWLAICRTFICIIH